MSEPHTNLLQFYPLSSVVDTGFWHVLADKKLDSFKLDDSAVKIFGTYRNDAAKELPPLISVNYDSFNDKFPQSRGSHLIIGKLIVTNTIEDFINKDKKELLQELGNEIWSDILNNRVEKRPSEALSKFLLLVYADLKNYRFHYWFGFPALCFPENCFLVGDRQVLADKWTKEQIIKIQNEVKTLEHEDQSYFIIAEKDNHLSVHLLSNYGQLKENFKIYFTFVDSCTSQDFPGWTLRNFLAFITYHYRLDNCLVISYRIKGNSAQNSILFNIKCQVPDQIENIPKCVGWEKNEAHKLLPRKVDLKHVLDPICLAENSVDLNLKLMKWRLVPSLDLDTISTTKCLLLGSGTLGCSIARGLLAWGVRTITFVDNSIVSFSNPVRQPLFYYTDCLEGGQPKSLAAAKNLRLIFPSVNANGIQLSIPMPGHPVVENTIEQVKKDVDVLESLIENHDVIFLLTDTRESRWLPTVLSAIKNKLVINAALGFDTFLVLRHSMKSEQKEQTIDINTLASSSKEKRAKKIPGSRLGCYFCNDVVAPGNSTRDRTLDQQCTVTRPGVSMLASALAVEMMVSVLQHPLRGAAPALSVSPDDCFDSDVETPLGIVPHQIRGFLSRFQQVMPTCEKFEKCTACSEKILESYTTEGFDFLLKVFNDSNYLEELSGLKQLHTETNLDDIWALSDEEQEESEENS